MDGKVVEQTPGLRGRGVAGRRGDDVRSDLWVAVEIRAAGGIELELSSRVAPYYGDSIREQVASDLERLGVHHAHVEIEDQGSLPYVISARLEAAVRRAGIDPAREALAETFGPAPVASRRDRLRRSRLYLPGNEPKYFINAGLHRPDGIILDLEDSVHPDEKDTARLLVRNALRGVDFHGAERMVRINQLPLGLADLEAVAPQHPELILIPKVEQPDEIVQVDQVLDRLVGDREIWIMPILESALGIENALQIARAGKRVVALTLGLEDYAADLGVPKSVEGEESLYARTRVVNAARAAGLQAIDSVYGRVGDMEGLATWGRRSRQLGFSGMGCLHPRQIGVIHDAFNPSEEQIEKAKRIVAAFEEAQSAGLGVVSLGSKMIDPPVIKQAQRLVEQARETGLLGDGEENP